MRAIGVERAVILALGIKVPAGAGEVGTGTGPGLVKMETVRAFGCADNRGGDPQAIAAFEQLYRPRRSAIGIGERRLADPVGGRIAQAHTSGQDRRCSGGGENACGHGIILSVGSGGANCARPLEGQRKRGRIAPAPRSRFQVRTAYGAYLISTRRF